MRRLLHSLLSRVFSTAPIYNLVREQVAIFARMGLEREQALNLLQEVSCKVALRENFSKSGMSSEHLVLFASMAARGEKFKRILEIGTFQGITTTFLGYLFPNSEIDTIDLSHEDVRRNDVYSYGLKNYDIKEQTPSNTNFLTLNSLRLLSISSSYDLVWVDGNHLSPYSISDIVNAVRLVSATGYVVCDDIYLKKPFIDKNADLSSITILRAMSDADIISYELILKRLGKRFNNFLAGRKYIAVVRKRT